MTIQRTLLLGAAVLSMTCGLAFAQDTTEEKSIAMQLRQKMMDYYEEHEDDFDMEAYNAFMKELATEVDVDTLDAGDLSELVSMNILSANEEVLARATDRLQTFADDQDAGGAAASITMFAMNFRSDDQQKIESTLRNALTHPGLKDALNDGKGTDLFFYLGSVDTSILMNVLPELLSVSELITTDLPAEVVAASSGYLTTLNSISDAMDVRRESIREQLVAVTSAAADKAEADALAAGDAEPTGRDMGKYLRGRLAFLNGAFARGELMHNTAPTIDLTWSSGNEFNGAGAPTTLADLHGKVVIVDFWATWCGPCIASFPNVRELQERYQGYDVAIVGVTSLQGKHYPGEGPPVDTEGDPQKEYDLMREFMKAKDITWDIAFSEQDVFNPDFGVRGIPHVAIIGADGKVHYNGLHPATPLKEKADKIDALLTKAGLPAPAPAPTVAIEDAE